MEGILMGGKEWRGHFRVQGVGWPEVNYVYFYHMNMWGMTDDLTTDFVVDAFAIRRQRGVHVPILKLKERWKEDNYLLGWTFHLLCTVVTVGCTILLQKEETI